MSIQHTNSVVTIAASNTPATQKRIADYECDGTNDEVTIAAAIAALRTSGTVTLTGASQAEGANYTSQGGTVLLDAMSCRRPVLIVFEKLHYGADKMDSPVFKLRDHVQLTIRDANRLWSGMASCVGMPEKRTTAIRLDGCKFHNMHKPESFVDAETSKGPWHCSWSGCHEYYGKPFEDGYIGED